MRRFALGVLLYSAACCLAIAVILLRGLGPSPRVVALYPTNGDRYWPGGVAQITFSQPMDQQSVERALQVTPGSQGQGTWFGNTLNLQPVGDWRPDTTYHVRLVGSVSDSEGRSLNTPPAFVFRVHHVGSLFFCRVAGVRNVCEHLFHGQRLLTRASTDVLGFALSGDGTLLAYIRRDRSNLPHLFVIGVDGSESRQLTFGRAYADSMPSWSPNDSNDITYRRRPVNTPSHGTTGAIQLWNVQIDGTQNARIQ